MELFVKLAKFDNAEIIDIDGLKVIYPDGWGLIRCSNTTSDIILRFEADTEETLNKIKKRVKDNILKVDKNINIPF
jgi:phosphomannomutase